MIPIPSTTFHKLFVDVGSMDTLCAKINVCEGQERKEEKWWANSSRYIERVQGHGWGHRKGMRWSHQNSRGSLTWKIRVFQQQLPFRTLVRCLHSDRIPMCVFHVCCARKHIADTINKWRIQREKERLVPLQRCLQVFRNVVKSIKRCYRFRAFFQQKSSLLFSVILTRKNTAISPANMRKTWIVSVQTTALIPPWMRDGMREYKSKHGI